MIRQGFRSLSLDVGEQLDLPVQLLRDLGLGLHHGGHRQLLHLFRREPQVHGVLYAEVEARVVTAGVLTLSKPTGSAQLNRALRMLCATRERLRQMEQRQLTVEKKMEQIRIVNRAKLLLMQCLSMTETDAHRYIEKQAMNLRLSKSQVAQNIIRTYGGNLD